MAFNPEIHHRRSIRLRGYDYSQPGAYFVTTCTWQRERLFGEIIDGEMELNGMGEIVAEEWRHTAAKRRSVTLGEFVVMPNHFHAIVIFGTDHAIRFPGSGTDTVGARFIAPDPAAPDPAAPDPAAPDPAAPDPAASHPGVINHAPTLGEVVRRFKARTTFAINTLHNTRGRPIWQRNYWERIIRSEEEHKALCDYIRQNPAQWEADKLYSAR